MNNVSEFYDEFFSRRMKNYREKGNKRLDCATDLIRQYVCNGDVVADIGCGIGIVTERLAQEFPESLFISIDISNENVSYAKENIKLDNVKFICASVSNQFNVLKEESKKLFDVVFLVDVIEHIPQEHRAEVIENIYEITGEDATLILTYPSPEYQVYLQTNNPKELQIIDNIIEIEKLIGETRACGWLLKSYRYIDIWRTNQYIHAVFQKRLITKEAETGVEKKKKRKNNWIKLLGRALKTKKLS
jgi:2-polyprenyl-3-methyl-5-hydroxy-6-metoxy-1,4-benzoquinol methylase